MFLYLAFFSHREIKTYISNYSTWIIIYRCQGSKQNPHIQKIFDCIHLISKL